MFPLLAPLAGESCMAVVPPPLAGPTGPQGPAALLPQMMRGAQPLTNALQLMGMLPQGWYIPSSCWQPVQALLLPGPGQDTTRPEGTSSGPTQAAVEEGPLNGPPGTPFADPALAIRVRYTLAGPVVGRLLLGSDGNMSGSSGSSAARNSSSARALAMDLAAAASAQLMQGMRNSLPGLASPAEAGAGRIEGGRRLLRLPEPEVTVQEVAGDEAAGERGRVLLQQQQLQLSSMMAVAGVRAKAGVQEVCGRTGRVVADVVLAFPNGTDAALVG